MSTKYAYSLTDLEQGRYVELTRQLLESKALMTKFEDELKEAALKFHDILLPNDGALPTAHFMLYWRSKPSQYDIEVINGKHAVIEYQGLFGDQQR